MTFCEAKHPVANRGEPPDSFLAELVAWARTAPEEIFAPNANQADAYALIATALGNEEPPRWNGPRHRRAALMELMRVHAGFESSWNWNEGVDILNEHSRHSIFGQETGIFQVSFDSLLLAQNAMLPFARERGIGSAQGFIKAMKLDHELALEFYARLVRRNIQWAGPLDRREVLPYLRRGAMTEFEMAIEA